MSDTLNEVSMPGGRIAARLARLLSDSVIHTQLNMRHVKTVIGSQIFTEATNHVSNEIRSAMGPLWRQVAVNPGTPTELRSLFTHLGSTQGQAWAWIAGAATGTAVGSGLTGVLNNTTAPIAQAIIMNNPNGLLSPEAVAQAIGRGVGELLGEIPLVDEAAKGGLSDARLRYLIELARQTPDVVALLEMFNRKLIDRATLSKALQRHGFASEWHDEMRALAHKEFTLADVTALWNRSAVTDAEAFRVGRAQGYDDTQVQAALELGGEPLGVQELGDAFRRGIIDRTRFNRGIVQGPIRNEWFDVVEALQFSRMSTVDAADAVNQGHMDLSEGRRVAHENGLVPEDFETLIATAGQPPGIDFATEAFNRGLIDNVQFREMFLESRIKNRYLPLLEQMRTRIIPQETVRLLYRNGVYSREKTLQTLMWHGFTPDDAAALLALEDARQDETTRELTRAQIVAMYEDQIFDSATASELLRGMGYSDTNVELMVALSDIKRTQRFINAAITRIRSAYVTGKLDEVEASGQLDRLLVPPVQRDELLTIWDIDRTTITKTLTPSQIRQAVGKNLITREDGLARLEAQGYDQIDADLFLQLTA